MSKELNLLKKVVSEILRKENISLSPEMNASDIEGWDSMNHMQILFTLENQLKDNLHANKVNLRNY